MTRRAKYGFLPKRVALGWLAGRTRIVNLPEDAMIQGFFHEYTRDGLGIYISSESFPEVPEYECLEYVELIFETEDSKR